MTKKKIGMTKRQLEKTKNRLVEMPIEEFLYLYNEDHWKPCLDIETKKLMMEIMANRNDEIRAYLEQLSSRSKTAFEENG